MWSVIKYKRTTMVLCVLILCFASGVFFLKYSVVSLEEKVKLLQSEVKKSLEQIHIMKTELQILTSAERLRGLVEKYTDYRPVSANRLRRFEHEQIFRREKILDFVDSLPK